MIERIEDLIVGDQYHFIRRPDGSVWFARLLEILPDGIRIDYGGGCVIRIRNYHGAFPKNTTDKEAIQLQAGIAREENETMNMADEIKKAVIGSKIPAHFYSCEECCLMFAAEQALEDQSEIVCPICQSDEHLHDAGSGVMILEQPADDTDLDDLDK